MKKLLLLLVFLVSCAAPEPEIIYVEVTSTPEPTPEIQPVGCEYYFDSWEIAKNAIPPASGQYWYLAENEALIFIKDEISALHEVGHFVDMERGYPSQSLEFREAVVEYLSTDREPYWIINYYHEQEQFDEIYAHLYMVSLLFQDELPEIFEEFYAR